MQRPFKRSGPADRLRAGGVGRQDPCSFCQTNGKTCTCELSGRILSGKAKELTMVVVSQLSRRRILRPARDSKRRALEGPYVFRAERWVLRQISYLDHRLGNLEAGVGVRLDQVESALRELMPMYSAYKSWAASNPDTSKADSSFSTIPYAPPLIQYSSPAHARTTSFESSDTGPGFTPLIPSVTVPSTSSALNPTPSLSYRPSAELRTMLGEGSRGRLSGNLSASSSPAQEEGTEPRSWSDRFSHHSADSLGNLR